MAKVLIMGVSGSGKSTIGRALAAALGVPFIEGDDFHPKKNVEKMASGLPLIDEDRWLWLEELRLELARHEHCVLSCSALKESYRTILCSAGGADRVVYLYGSYDLIHQRIARRSDHYMPAQLLQSQFDDLQEPTDCIAISITTAPQEIINNILAELKEQQSMDMKKYEIGLLGLGVMGKSLARNFASRGITVSIYNIPFPGEEKVVEDFAAAYPEAKFYAATSLEDFVGSLAGPKVVFLMIKAGEAIDEMIVKLKPLLGTDDMIIDGGNSFFKDTRRRAIALEKEGLHFVGVGVSGGEEGALKGPAIMPAGTDTAKQRILPMLQKIAAVADGQPCVKWIGKDGAGHFVKMIHNGIEYADMQLLSEAYAICKEVAGLTNTETADLFESWKAGLHNSYLLDITIDILRKQDEDGSSLLEKILDVAGHKGTGKWTSMEALELGVASPAMTAAMHQRIISSFKGIRANSKSKKQQKNSAVLDHLEEGLLAARLINLTEGFHMMRVASEQYGWHLKFDEISQLWRGGCIIRSDMLPQIRAAFEAEQDLQHLILNKNFADALTKHCEALNQLLAKVSLSPVATPCLSATANYFKSMTTAYLPINMIQAQRDYFGAHTYKRVDSPEQSRHTQWTD